MATKKSTAKRVRKATGATDPAVLTQIKQAAERIPTMLADTSDRRANDAAKASTPRRSGHPTLHHYSSKTHRQKKAALWSAVGVISTFIIFLWFWNIRSAILDVNFARSTENALWQTARSELATIFATIETPNASASEPSVLVPLAPSDQAAIEASIATVFATSVTTSTSTVSTTTSTTNLVTPTSSVSKQL